MDPPAEMEQYSNNPSKIGLSSPTLSIPEQGPFFPISLIFSRHGVKTHLHLHFCCSLAYPFAFSGLILYKKSTYSSVWN
jgi:hypothetical protein